MRDVISTNIKIGVFLLAAAASIAFYIVTYPSVHPEAALHISVSRAEAVEIAREAVERQGIDLSGYRRAVRFKTDYNTKSFLEKEFGLGVANDLMGDEIRTWYWWVRWFIPEQEEEFGAAVDPSGRLVYYSHYVEEDRAEESVDAERAEELALEFLEMNTSLDLEGYELISTREIELPNRVQHKFVWKLSDLNLGDAEYKVSVNIEGSRVGYFNELLDVPQDWSRDERRKSSRRGLIMTVASLLESFFGFAALGVLVWALQSKLLRWKFALGVSAFMMVLTAALSINALPGAWMNYSTTESVTAFYGDWIVGLGGSLIVAPISLIVLMGPGEALARRVLPQHVSLAHIFRKVFWRGRSTVTAVTAGWGLAALHLGYLSAFYLIAKSLGAWSPQSGPSLDALATPFPWLYPIATGAFAALEEEFTFRLFAIAFLLMVTKSRTIAVLVPAVVWAFLHSTYPQEPVYIRGLELSVVGITYGIFFLRFGLISTLTAHYAYNAVVSGAFLLRSGDTLLALSGAAAVAVVALPVLPAVLGFFRGRRLLTDEQVLKCLDDGHAAAGPEATSGGPPPNFIPYMPLPRFRRIALAAIAGLSLLAILFVPQRTQFGEYVEVRVDYREATRLAAEYMRERGVDPTAYRCTVEYYEDLQTRSAHYLAQHMNRQELNETFQRRFPNRPYWYVHYFQPLSIEGYAVEIAVDGRVVDFDHWLPEEADGPRLSPEEAQAIAEEYISRETDIDLSTWHIVDASMYEREARNDHWFVWEDDAEKVDEATYRVSISVMGDQAVDIERYLNTPDAWSRERSERQFSDTLLSGVSVVLGLAFAGVVLVFIIILVLNKLIQVPTALVVAMFAVLAEVVLSVNSLNTLWDGYGTSEEPGVYLSETLISWFVEDPMQTLAISFMAIVLMDAALRYVFPRRYPLAYWLGLPALAHPGTPVAPRLPLILAWTEAVLVALAMLVFIQGSDHLLDAKWFHGDAEIEAQSIHDNAPDALIDGGYETFWPSVGVVARSVSENLSLVALLVGLACIWKRYFFRLRWAVVFVLLVSALEAWGESHSVREGIEEGVMNLFANCVGFSLLYFLMKWFLRDNLPTYFLFVLAYEPFENVLELLRSHNAFERSHGFILLAAFFACALAALLVYLRQLKAWRPPPGTPKPAESVSGASSPET